MAGSGYDINKKIYIVQPKGFRLSNKERKVQQLYKALYSLEQAGLSQQQIITSQYQQQYKYDANIFIDKETRELVIVIDYINNVSFIGSKGFLLLSELKQKFITK